MPDTALFEQEISIKVTANDIRWKILRVDLLKHPQIMEKQTKACNEIHHKLENAEVPDYVRPIILQLIESESIPRHISLNLIYISFNDMLIIAYDATHSDRRPVTTATIEQVKQVSDREKEGKTTLLGELKALFEMFSSDSDDSNLFYDYWKEAGYITHEITFDEFKITRDGSEHIGIQSAEFTARLKTELYRHPFGEFATLLPIPRFPQPSDVPEHAIVLGSLNEEGCFTLCQTVWDNIESLKSAVSGQGPKIVFIGGEPGSGKEVYARALHFGSFRSNNSRFVVRSIANMTAASLARDLYGEMTDSGFHIPGKIEEASGGTLFLDEFDKIKSGEDGAYRELLRVLEAKEYVPQGGNTPKKFDDVNWILSGAFTDQRMIDDLPPDIWSRFTHEIRITNPISPKLGDQSGYIVSLFLYWTFKEALKAIGSGGEKGNNGNMLDNVSRLFNENAYKVNCVRRILFGPEIPHDKRNPLKAGNNLIVIARHFSRYAGTYLMYKISLPNDKEKTTFVPFDPLRAGQADGMEFRKFSEDAERDARAALGPSPAMTLNRRCDSIRAIRQGTLVVFDKLLEAAIKKGVEFMPAKDGKLEDIGKEALRQAFKTIDLARTGEKAERMIEPPDSARITTEMFL